MPKTFQLEIIYQDMGTFAKAIVPKRTVWTLKELMAIAELPKDAALDTRGLKMETYDEFRDVGIDDIDVFIDRYYDKDGNELIRKSKMVTRKIRREERVEEVSYVPKEDVETKAKEG